MFRDYVQEIGAVTSGQNRALGEKAITERGMTYYKALMDSGLLSQESVVNAALAYYRMDCIENPYKARIDFELTERLYGIHGHLDIDAVIRNRQFFVRSGDALFFVLNDPENDTDKSKVKILLGGGVPIKYTLLTEQTLAMYQRYQIQPARIALMSRTDLQPDRIAQYDNPMSIFLDTLFENALLWRATDLRIIPLEKVENDSKAEAQVWLTVDGKNTKYTTIFANILPNLRNVVKNRCHCPDEKNGKPVEGRLTVRFQSRNIDVRVNIVPSFNGYDFNFRFITTVLRSLDDLGMSKENLEKYKRVLNLTKGLVVISGPTGSGKTSLLYAGFRVALSANRAIYSVESPVEIQLSGITQVETDDTTGMTRQQAFDSALRHRPDIIAFGEIRNLSDAQPAISFSMTGHPAHATLHANNSVSVVSRLVNMGVDPYVLGDTLAAVVSQRLVRRICPDCAEEYDLPQDHPWRKTFDLGDGPVRLKRGCGCAKCAGTGYYGQMAINEIMLTTPEIRTAIQAQKGTDAIRQILERDLFKTYLEDGKEKALTGMTTFEELYDIANDIL